jgi:hypothetical protein
MLGAVSASVTDSDKEKLEAGFNEFIMKGKKTASRIEELLKWHSSNVHV